MICVYWFVIQVCQGGVGGGTSVALGFTIHTHRPTQGNIHNTITAATQI